MNPWRRLRGNPSRSIAPLAWFLIPLLLFIAILIYFFGDTEPQSADIHLLEVAPSGEGVWLGSPNEPDWVWSESYVAPSEEVRAQLLQNLARFRGERAQQGIQLAVTASADNEAGARAAQQLGTALGQYGLGRTARASGESDNATISILRAPPRDRGMARQLLAALSPYLRGEIWVQYDESISTRSMTLHLADQQLFGEDGTVWYGLD